MTSFNIFVRIVMALGLLVMTSACGDSGGSGSNNNAPPDNQTPTQGVTALSVGEIEGFGSIIVNGIEFETTHAEVEMEHGISELCSPSATEDCGLHVGMIVTLENAFDDSGTPRAVTKISYADNLQGPIGAYEESTPGQVKTLTILGQTVTVQNGVTRFDDNDADFDAFEDLGPGNLNEMVEISGFPNYDGTLRATYIERKSPVSATEDLFEIKGTVLNLNTAAGTFEINGLVVDYSQVVVGENRLSNGIPVEVKGNALNGNTLTATEVEVKSAGLGFDDLSKARLEGYVTNLDVSTRMFKIHDQWVSYANAAFVGGIEAELLDGIKVEAEGPVVAGTLQAIKVEFKEAIKFEANVESVDAGTRRLTLEGLPGIIVTVDGLTEFGGAADLNAFSPGNHLKIRGRRTASTETEVLASEIELISSEAEDRTIIQGPVESFTAMGSVTLLGVVVTTDTIENEDFKDEDVAIGAVEFYNRLNVGDLVKARLDLTGNRWDQIEFEK